jgi:NADH:ubiquinone oxidoreductase subunit 3 (subunit A)
MMNPRRWIALLALLFLVVAPDVAHACPVCFDPREENRVAYLATTAFMSLFPLGVVGGFAMWLRKRARTLRGVADEGGDDQQES